MLKIKIFAYVNERQRKKFEADFIRFLSILGSIFKTFEIDFLYEI